MKRVRFISFGIFSSVDNEDRPYGLLMIVINHFYMISNLEAFVLSVSGIMMHLCCRVTRRQEGQRVVARSGLSFSLADSSAPDLETDLRMMVGVPNQNTAVQAVFIGE